MRVLICAQAVDTQDLTLGFFARWVEEFAKHNKRVSVICLTRGAFTLPENVSIYSLGKERTSGLRFMKRMRYIARLYTYAWKLRKEYDVVFVHMNQEYVVLLGWLWKFMGKRVYMWRNHYEGSFLTDIAASFCDKVFCTSKRSYTARYKKTVLMPVGVDIDTHTTVPDVARLPRSILWYARVAPSKRLELFIEALGILRGRNIPFSASVYGSPSPEDAGYYDALKARASALGLSDSVRFVPGAPHSEGPRIFSTHEIFVNTSPPGMYDKTIFEACACECLVLVSSTDVAGKIDPRCIVKTDTAEGIAAGLQTLLELPPDERIRCAKDLGAYARGHQSLQALWQRLAEEMRT